MKTEQQWMEEACLDPTKVFWLPSMIRAIQDDAQRSAIEKCAALCDQQVSTSRLLETPSGLAEICRNRIRALLTPTTPEPSSNGKDGR